MKKKLLIAFLALCMLVMPLVSCKKDNKPGDDTRETIELDTSDGYDYGKLDC